MSDLLLNIYHRLPPPARSFAASIRGFYLRSWRYGENSEELVEAAIDRENWSAVQWRKWQEERLAYTLHRAATRVPYYRDHWSKRRLSGDRASAEELKNWPILSKEELRSNPRAFIADDCDVKKMFHDHTSGTSGKPLDLWLSRETVREWYALFEARVRRWHGVSRYEPWAILGGQPVIPANVRKPPFWVWNAPMKQLYLSSNHISSDNAESFIDALKRYGVTHLITYSSSAAMLAREAARLNLRVESLKTVITNAEPLFPWQREAIRAGLGCEARETYGMAEIAAAAGECPDGGLHIWPEAGWIELLNDQNDSAAEANAAGRLICTGLINADMPLIRYQVGDRARLQSEATQCKCGRSLPIFAAIEGRTNDMLITKDGRRIYWLNPVFYSLPVKEAQIIQESIESIRVRYVPAAGFNGAHEKTIVDRLRLRAGDVEVKMEPVDQIPRGPNGKFQAVICSLSESEERLRHQLK